MLSNCSPLASKPISYSFAWSCLQSRLNVRHASSGKKTLYDVLELPQSASSKDIKSSFYRLSMKYHPDRNVQAASSSEKFREVSEAYQVLSNQESKKLYDAELNDHRHVASADGRAVRPRPASAAGAAVRARPPPPTGRSRIYNFDEFYRQHYGDSLKGHAHETARREQAEHRGERWKSGVKGWILAMIAIVTFFHLDEWQEQSRHAKQSNSDGEKQTE